jgi:hypothetical protein
MTTITGRRGKEVTLPSGDTVVLRGVGFDTLLLTDRVPDFLTPLVVNAVNGSQVPLPSVEEDVEKTKEMAQFINLVCELAFVSPRIVPTPQAEDEISMDDLDMIDKRFVFFNVLGKPTRWLNSFRHEQAQDVGGVGDGEGLPDTTEPIGEVETAVAAG